MTQVPQQTLNVGVDALLTTTGAKTLRDGSNFVALTANTFYFPVSNGDATSAAVHVETDAAIAGTFTLEFSNAPKDPSAGPDTTDFDPAAGKWLTWVPPTTAPVLVAAGSTNTAGSVAVVAGAVGGFMWLLPDFGARRCRVKAVITTPGKCRVMPSGKY